MNLQDWANTWLKYKGPNTIVPEYEADQHGVITSFKLRQGFTKFTDPVYRQQSLNIGFFDNNGLHRIEKVVLKPQELTDVP